MMQVSHPFDFLALLVFVPVPPLHPPARDNAARGCAGETRPGGGEDNANLQVRLLRETKGCAAFPLLSGEALTEHTPGPWRCQDQGAAWLSRSTGSTQGTVTSSR